MPLRERLLSSLGRPQISGFLIRIISLARESLGDCRVAKRLIVGGISEGGKIEKARRRILFTQVNEHGVNNNNKIYSLLTINPISPFY